MFEESPSIVSNAIKKNLTFLWSKHGNIIVYKNATVRILKAHITQRIMILCEVYEKSHDCRIDNGPLIEMYLKINLF